MSDAELLDETERLLLAACMLHGSDYVTSVRAAVGPGDFLTARHQHIAHAVFRIHDRGEDVEPVTVAAQLGGLLEDAGGLPYLSELITGPTPSSSPTAYLRLIVDDAWRRRMTHEVAELGRAVADGPDVGRCAIDAFVTAATRERVTSAAGGLALVEWPDLYADARDSDPIVDGIAYAGRWTALAAPGKAGKSTLTFHIAVSAARGVDPFDDTPTDPVDVLYLDPEMGRVDVLARLTELQIKPTDLDRLHYTDLVPKLDDPSGAAAVLSAVDQLAVRLVVLDGLNGVVAGAEKDDTPWRNLYDHTIAPLKRRGVAVLTCDNLGKDKALGPRGSSVKVDKPDAVVQLTRTDQGVALKATHRRTAVYPLEQNLIVRGLDGGEPISYRHAFGGWPAGTSGIAAVLEQLGVPITAGRGVARAALVAARDAATDELDAGRFKASDVVLSAALRYRRTEHP